MIKKHNSSIAAFQGRLSDYESIKHDWGDKPYYSLDHYLKKQYGEKIYKIALDAGMTCPNRDGRLDTRGCIFCSAGGSGDFASCGISIHEQLENGKALFHEKKTGNRFIAYFQSFTNTYAEPERLEILFTEALSEPDVVGISIATRPDCVERPVVNLLTKLKQQFPDKFIWIELGLQTIHEKTAQYIRRGYPLSVFEDTLNRLQKADIPVIVHMILGLPGENKEMMLSTCRYLSHKNIFGIKLQLLHVLKNTDLAADFSKKTFEILDLMEYIDIVISCLEVLSPDIVIHRVTGDGPKDLLIAPLWSLNKRNVLNTLHKELRLRETFQGRLFIPDI
ncbi:MAG: TIGR01212 family radical SAM protein [Lachnospiraceae bacterium]|nr:TIGR01212 family radical SAM protein [Lachnospiraceae bacterium]